MLCAVLCVYVCIYMVVGDEGIGGGVGGNGGNGGLSDCSQLLDSCCKVVGSSDVESVEAV